MAAQPAVRVGLYQNLPKVGWSEAGKPEGLFVDILEAIAVEEGWTIDYVPGTWAEGLARLERGEIDLMPDVALNDERQALYAFHAEPVLSSWFHIYARHGGGIRSLLDLDGKRIALLEGSIQQSALEKMVREFDLTAPLLTFADYDAAFAAVIAGRADAVVANRFYSTAHLRDDPIEDTGIIFHPTRLFFAASRSGDPALLEAIDRHLARMKPDPASAYYRSFRRWTSEEMPARIPVWLKLVALAALLGLALALGWNFALNRRVEARARQLSESERRFTELFNANPSGLLLVERSSRIIAQVNPAAAAMIGLPPERIVGKKCHGFMCPAEETACPVCDLGQTVDRSERVLIDARGTSRPILKSVVPIQLDGTEYLLESFIDISQRKHAEDQLRLFQTLVEHSSDAIGMSTPDGRHYYQNEAFKRLFGPIGENPPETLFVDAALGRRIFETIQAGGHWQGEVEMYRQDRSILDIFLRAYAIRDAQGPVLGLVGLHTDVTERKRTQKRLRVHAQLLDSVRESVVASDLDGRIIYWGRGAEHMFGYAPDEVMGRPYRNFAGAIDPPDEQAFRRSILEQGSWSGEVLQKNRHGAQFWTSTFISPVLDEAGQAAGYIGIDEDITERKRIQQALQASERLLREAQHIAGVGSYALDIPSGAWTASDELHAILGMDPAAPHTVETWENLLHPDDRDRMSDYFREDVIGKGLPFHREYRIVRADSGEQRWVLGIGRLESNPEGRPVRMIGTIQDITERKNSEAEKDRLAEELQQSRKMESIGRLAGGVAHDFNNMLQIISGNAELALADIPAGDGADAARDCVRDVLKASERSAQLVCQLLAFARKQTIMPRTLDLNETVESTLKMLQRLIGEQVELFWRPAVALWPVKADPVQLDQILTNLCLNARDAMSNGGQITIETANATFDEAFCARHSYHRPGEYVMLAIGDNGTGMDKETMRQLFEPFFTTKALGQGTGLGLATVYGIVKQNHGFIDVYSEPGRGSLFKIYLPRHSEPARQPIHSASAPPPCGGGKTILLVDDDPAILDITCTLLEKIGYRVLSSLNPIAALQLANEHSGSIHLLLTDVVMPEMNGRDLARNIQEMRPGIPCLFMSGYTANVIAHHGVLDPNFHFIQKPFSIEALAAKVCEALDA